MPRAAALLPIFLLATPLPRVASAEVHRCEMPSGGTAYTDRRCDELGAVERVPSAAEPQSRFYRSTCSRTLRDLAYELSAAIEAHDVNRLAGVYHWAGMSTSQGYATMRRLQAIVDRPLVDLQPMYPRSLDADMYPQQASSRPPIGLRLAQVSKNGSTPVDTVLGLRKNLDCWWVAEGGSRVPAARKPSRPPADSSSEPEPAAGDTPPDAGPNPSAPVDNPAAPID